MPPIPQELSSSEAEDRKQPEPTIIPLKDDDIVISGLSGLFPQSHNLKEFSEKLYKHENLTSSINSRWNCRHPELTEHIGNVPDLNTFDAQFFMVHHHLANTTDVMSKKLLEHTYQAIFDSGYSPNELFGKKMGVYIGTSLTETESLIQALSTIGTGIMGCNRAMFSNRISYWLNAKGPSITLDASCSSTMVCLEKAYEAIRSGDIEAAIVGGCNVHLKPQSCIHYERMFGMNPDGKTKCFDKNADGPSPSECICVFFLQKAKFARRIYANVCYVKTEFSLLDADFSNRYGPHRNPSILSSFYYNFYEASNTVPQDVEYVEAFGSSYFEADKKELEAIQEVFCKNRSDRDPLHIGSIMSNMGFSNAATTAAALTKMCLAYQTGKIPANLHYVTPRDDIPAIRDGRMRVVTDNRPFGRTYAAINSLSLSGINGHMLLKGQYKPKDLARYESKIPYLLTASGRQESGVELILEDFKKNPIDPEAIALIHNIHKHRNAKHLARGYAILTCDVNQEPICAKKKVDYFDDAKRPLWFVYSGMGSQWNGMGKELMRIPLFASAIMRCHNVLEPKGVDLLHVITTDDKNIFNNIINSFVGISAVQIGLTDVLLGMGLKPDNLIGHSMGEMGCAYADGCITLEEMILASYYRGLVSNETPLIKGAMAAVGLGCQEIQSICPPEVDVACHNSRDSCTISGPFEVMSDFVTKLNSQGIFAKAVNSSNIAYHSKYIKDAVPAFLKHLKTLFKNPKPRSEKWLSTSVPKEKWHEPLAQMSSAEYHANNMLVPVLFEETANAIPANAVLIEVAPHGLLQAILKRSLPPTCTHILLTRRNNSDHITSLLEAFGELYMSGYNPDLSVLYPKVEFPVSTETRSLSHLVEWVHSEKWRIPVYNIANRACAASYDTKISTYDTEYSFLKGHIINDEVSFPLSFALVLVWDTLAMSLEAQRKQISVQFNDVHFHAQPLIFDHRLLKFRIQIHKGTGWFEMVNEHILVASGYIQALNETNELYREENEQETFGEMLYTSNDIYRMLHERGYDYRDEFRSIQNGNTDMTQAIVSWNNNWTTLIDAVIQMNVLRRDYEMTERPRFIQQLNIDINLHNRALQLEQFGPKLLEAYYFEDQNRTRCGGVMIRNVLFASSTPHERKSFGYNTLKFIPYNRLDEVDISEALSTILQILAENANINLNAVDLTNQESDSFLYTKIKDLLHEFRTIKLNISKITRKEIHKSKKIIESQHFVLVDGLLMKSSVLQVLSEVIPPETFVVILEERAAAQPLYQVVASAVTTYGRLVLGRWTPKPVTVTECYPDILTVTSPEDIPRVKVATNNLSDNRHLYILTYYPPMSELKDLVKECNKDTMKNKVCLAMVPRATELLQENELPHNFNLTYNVLQNGIWGGYFYIGESQNYCKELQGLSFTSALNGKLDSLHWTRIPEPKQVNIAVSVHYAGLSLYDARRAIGDITSSSVDQYYGMDFSGMTSSGERVMGVVRGGAASTLVSPDPTLLWPVPEHWTLEDAASVPLAYAYAFYCLGVKCKLAHGMSVLVHGASGALGEAIISIALANNCTVFAAVSSMKKKQLLRKVFPNLPGNQIGNSRHEAFLHMVLTATHGRGCDIVISCVKGHLKNISFGCCAIWGTTLDIQILHSKELYTFGMYNLTKSRSYAAIDFSAVFKPENQDERNQLKLMVSEGIARGYVRPLSRITYGAHESARAMRLISKSQHYGRVLLRIHGEAIPTTQRLAINPSGSYLVLSATAENDVALRVVDLLIRRGAVNILLYLLHNKSHYDAYMHFKIMQWKKLGGKVKTFFGPNIKEQKEEFVKVLNSSSPIDGLFTVLASTSDGETDIETVSLQTNLDDITRRICPSLRFFVIIDNITEIGRNICINRTLDGYPALLLQLPNINKFRESNNNMEEILFNKDGVPFRNMIPVLEKALCLSTPVATVYTRTEDIEKTFFKEVSCIANLSHAADHNKKTNVLRLEPEKTHELLQILQKYDLVLPKQSISCLTLAKLKALLNNLKQKKTSICRGLEALFSSVNTDELQATSDLVFLPIDAAQSHEFDSNTSYLIMVPGMDGHFSKFEPLSKRLKISAVVIQPGFIRIHESVPEMAGRLVKVIMKRLRPKDKFYLLGYSYGVLVALEMASILENHGLTGVVFCVDASPDTFPSAMESWLREAGATNTSQLQDAIVKHVHTFLTGSTSDQLALQLQETTAWNDKVEVGIKAMRTKIKYSMQYIRDVMEAAYARISQTRQYDSNNLSPLRSQIILLRCHSNPYISSDLGLARFSKHKPQVYNIMEDHTKALDDLRCAEIINQNLDKQTIAYFNRQNLCNTYLHNTSTLSNYVNE